jgi:hypothetical protein
MEPEWQETLHFKGNRKLSAFERPQAVPTRPCGNIHLRVDKALEREEDKALREKLSSAFTAFDQNVDISMGRTVLRAKLIFGGLR